MEQILSGIGWIIVFIFLAFFTWIGYIFFKTLFESLFGKKIWWIIACIGGIILLLGKSSLLIWIVGGALGVGAYKFFKKDSDYSSSSEDYESARDDELYNKLDQYNEARDSAKCWGIDPGPKSNIYDEGCISKDLLQNEIDRIDGEIHSRQLDCGGDDD